MNDAQNRDARRLRQMDDTVGAENDFTQIGTGELRHYSTGEREVAEALDGVDDGVTEAHRVGGRIARDVLLDVAQVGRSRQRPADFRHRRRRSFNSSWLMVRPSATSRS